MTGHTHFFNAELAEKVGVAGATVLGNLAWLQLQHEYAGNVAMEHEGRWYVRHSYESLQQWHPYLTIPQLKRLMKSLEEDGYVVRGHLGKPFDRTMYWSVSTAVVDSTKSHNAKDEIVPSDSTKSHYVQQITTRDKEREVTPPKKRFEKPTVEMIGEYMKSLKPNSRTSWAMSEAHNLFDYYESNGWKVGKGPMKDWKSATRRWVKNDFKTTSSKPQMYLHNPGASE